MSTKRGRGGLAFLMALLAGGVGPSTAQAYVTASGGVVTTNGPYEIHTFAAAATTALVVTAGGDVEVLVVGGGGGGGKDQGGGGGGGAVVVTNLTLGAGTNTVVVGAGGAAGTVNNAYAGTGGASSFGAITANGGTGGRSVFITGRSGGNSGNGLFVGGNGIGNGSGGGGGGAGNSANGVTVTSTKAGDGGAGTTNDFSGATVGYGGGGGGGALNAATRGSGRDGGGNGGSVSAGTAGTPNTGGGGGGGAWSGSVYSGGSGGSGVVIAKFLLADVPVLSNPGVSNITTRSAMACVTLWNANADLYLFWDTSDKGTNATWAYTNVVGSSVSTGLISGVALSNLMAGQQYFFRFHATNVVSGVEAWSAAGTSCTTWPLVPVISNLTAGTITVSNATVYGNLVSTGETETTVFLLYGVSGGALTVTNLVGLQNSGLVSNTFTALPMGTRYDYQFAASNAAGWGYAPTTNWLTTLGPIRLTNDCDLSGGALIYGSNVLHGGSMTIANLGGSGTTANPWAYTVPGLDFASNQFRTANGDSLLLDLHGSNITGSSAATSVCTYRPGNKIALMGGVTISNVGSIACGKIDLHNGNTAWMSGTGNYQPGSLRIGDPLGVGSGPAGGPVRIDGIDTYVNDGRNPGSVTIYGSNDVLIQTANGLPGDIDTHIDVAEGTQRAGAVTILHRGAFAARDISAYSSVWQYQWPGGGNVALQGNYGGASTGPCSIRQVLTYAETNNYGSPAGSIVISGYASVTVSNLWSYSNTSGDRTPGSIAITNIAGPITINGTINANTRLGTTDGTLTLQTTTGSGGNITVSNLDLSVVSSASFNPDGAGFILGALYGTDGSPVTGTSTIGTALRLPAGKTIWYNKQANPGLAGGTYVLTNLAANASGGWLKSATPRGTALVFR